MKMHEMNEAFEKEGFDVKRDYMADEKTYYFSICKDGLGVCDRFTWNCNLSNYVNHERQERFIKKLISAWEKDYEKSKNVNNVYNVRRDLAIHGGEAELVVNNNVYPMRITDITVESLANEVPRMSVEGDLMSFTPERKEDLAKSMWRMMLNSVYGTSSDTGYIAVARGNGKSRLAMRQAFEMIGRSNPFAIEKVIFNGPATIVMWMDGTKTIVKCQDGDTFDPEKGLAMAISKKAFGNKGKYCDVFKKCLEDCDVYCETINTDPHTGDIYNAYQKLLDTLNNKKATKSDLGIAMEEAIGYLGHALG